MYDFHSALRQNCEFMAPGSGSGVQALWWGQYDHTDNVSVFKLRKYSSLHSQLREKSKIHGYDVHEAFYLHCEIYDLWVWGSYPWVRPIWQHYKKV